MPTVEAVEVEQMDAAFQASEDGPPLRLDHPPIDEILPLPAPQPGESGEADAATVSRGAVYHDARTGETITYPADPAAPPGDSGQTGGYPGIDGGGGSEQALLSPSALASFSDMTLRTHTGRAPWRMNAKLIVRFQYDFWNVWTFCSGTMIDAETVLTAGHCVYDGVHVPFGGWIERYGWAREIWVYPGYDGLGESSGWTPVLPASVGSYGRGHSTDFQTSVGWIDHGDPDYDLALVEVTRGVGMLTGWFGLSYGRDCGWHTSTLYHNVSYPSEDCPNAGLHNGQDMYTWYGEFDACGDRQLTLYTGGGNCFDTVWGGMMGSGAYYIDGDRRYVHGVATTSDRDDRAGYTRVWKRWVDYANDTFIPRARGSEFDLQPLDVDVEPTTIEAGSTTTLLRHAATNPTNGANLGIFTFGVYLSPDDNIEPSDTLLSIQRYVWKFYGMDAVGAHVAQVTIPRRTSEGVYYIGMIYDADTDIDETNNDTDNWDAARIYVLPICWADIDGDGGVTVADIQLVAGRWRQSPSGPKYDVDLDGTVTVIDIMLVSAEWGPCP